MDNALMIQKKHKTGKQLCWRFSCFIWGTALGFITTENARKDDSFDVEVWCRRWEFILQFRHTSSASPYLEHKPQPVTPTHVYKKKFHPSLASLWKVGIILVWLGRSQCKVPTITKKSLRHSFGPHFHWITEFPPPSSSSHVLNNLPISIATLAK